MRNLPSNEAEENDFIDLLDQFFYACDEGIEDIETEMVVITIKELAEIGATISGTLDEPVFRMAAKEFPELEVAAVLQIPSDGRAEIGSSYINIKSQEEGLRLQELIDGGRGWYRCDTFVPGRWTFFERE